MNVASKHADISPPSSFIQMSATSKADPMFKTMSYGFPLPRQVSFVGVKQAESKQYLI